jgi:hypothetical protein
MTAEKIDPDLLRLLADARDRPTDECITVTVIVTIDPDETKSQAVQDTATRLGLRLRGRGRLLVARLFPAQIYSLSDEPWCLYLEPEHAVATPLDPE